MPDDPPDAAPPARAARSPSPTDEDVCRHVAEECTKLRQMARRPRLRMVGYLLDMARLEAERIAKGEGR